MANCSHIFTAVLALKVALLVGLYFNQLIPDGLPDDQLPSVRFYGISWNAAYFMCYVASLAGSRSYPIETLNPVLRLWKPLVQTEVDKSWEIKDTTIANVPVLIYRPEYVNEGKKTTGVVYIHGGGWTFGSPDLSHSFTYQLARGADVVLISVDYRLAPRHTFPVQFHECYAVVTSVLENADHYGIDKNHLVIAGDSSGGNLAAAVVLKLRDENKKVAAQILMYPALQFMDFSLPSMKNKGSAVLTADDMARYWSYYITGSLDMVPSFLDKNHSIHLLNSKYSSYIGVNNKEQRKAQIKPMDGIPKVVTDALTDHRASPLMAHNMKGLPKTMLITCEYDVLRDEGLLYKKRLQDAGVNVTHKNYVTHHGFLLIQTMHILTTHEFHQALQDLADFIKTL